MQAVIAENDCAELGCGMSRRPEILNRRFLRGAGSAALVLAALVYGFGVLPGQLRNANMSHWTKSEAVILESSVQAENKSEAWGNGLREFTAYTPVVKYEYTSGSEQYFGDVVSLPKPTFRNPEEAKALVATFVAGSPHGIWVNPDDPTQAVLLKEDSTKRNVILGGAVMLAVLGCFGFLTAKIAK